MAEDTNTGRRAPGRLGKTLTTLGVAMLAVSILLAISGIEVATLNDILLIGGVGLALVGWVLWRNFKEEAAVFEGPVTLRETQDADGVRGLTATLVGGDLVIEGRDYGAGVERIFGHREYEWVWTVKADDVPRLREALGDPPDLTAALRRDFSGEAAAEIKPFLDSNAIPYEAWSRIGD